MKIGIDCRLWNETGVGRYTRNLVRELGLIDKKNYYVLFVLSKDYENVKFQMSNFKCQIVKVDIRWHTIREQLAFPKILEKEHLDLVHFPYFSLPIFYKGAYVVTIHDLIIHHFPTGQASTLPYPFYWLKLQGYKYVISQAAKHAQKVIAVSQSTKKEIIDHLHTPQEKIVVTYEGVEERSEVRSQKSNTPLSLKNYFLYVGNAYPHKNLDRLIEAFKLMQVKISDIHLILVGRNDYFYQRLRERYRDQNGLVFFGEANDWELIDLYQNAIGFVMPSLMEGFGLPSLEAMENNCLVLVSDIPSHQEICNNAAIYFDPYDIPNIARKMEDLIDKDQKERTRLKKYAKEHVSQFTWRSMAEKTLEIYESSLSIRPSE